MNTLLNGIDKEKEVTKKTIYLRTAMNGNVAINMNTESSESTETNPEEPIIPTDPTDPEAQ